MVKPIVSYQDTNFKNLQSELMELNNQIFDIKKANELKERLINECGFGIRYANSKDGKVPCSDDSKGSHTVYGVDYDLGLWIKVEIGDDFESDNFFNLFDIEEYTAVCKSNEEARKLHKDLDYYYKRQEVEIYSDALNTPNYSKLIKSHLSKL